MSQRRASGGKEFSQNLAPSAVLGILIGRRIGVGASL
jgi:hypothetical protein